jgi:hypothetical protein
MRTGLKLSIVERNASRSVENSVLFVVGAARARIVIGGRRSVIWRNSPVENKIRSALIRRAGVAISAIAIICLSIGSSSGACASMGEKATDSTIRSDRLANGLATSINGLAFELASAPGLVQDDDAPSTGDDAEVPPKMVEKYTNAYKAMQKDHNLTADQAAAAQGLTIAQFRSIEGRIERDDTLRERVRKALRASTPGAKESSNQ